MISSNKTVSFFFVPNFQSQSGREKGNKEHVPLKTEGGKRGIEGDSPTDTEPPLSHRKVQKYLCAHALHHIRTQRLHHSIKHSKKYTVRIHVGNVCVHVFFLNPDGVLNLICHVYFFYVPRYILSLFICP